MDKFTKLYDLTKEQREEVSNALWSALSYIEDKNERYDAHFNGMTSNSLCDLEDTINIYELSFMKQDATPIEMEEKKMNVRDYIRRAMANKVKEVIETIDLEDIINDAIDDVFDKDEVKNELRNQAEYYADHVDLEELVEEELYDYNIEEDVTKAYAKRVYEIARDETEDIIEDVVEEHINNYTF